MIPRLVIPVALLPLVLSGCVAAAPAATPTPTDDSAAIPQWLGRIDLITSEVDAWVDDWNRNGCDEPGLGPICLQAITRGADLAAESADYLGSESHEVTAEDLGYAPENFGGTYDTVVEWANTAAGAGAACVENPEDCVGPGSPLLGSMRELQSALHSL